MNDLNPHLIHERNVALQKALASHLDLVEQSRANLEESLTLEQIIKQAQTRLGRYIALQRLNERLNQVRQANAKEFDDGDNSSDLSRVQLMRIAVDAGLPLQKASQLYDLAVAEGKERKNN